MENYTTVNKIADALYGDVLLCKDTSGNKVAVKRMDWECANRRTTQNGSQRILEDAALEWKVNKVLSAHEGHQHVLQMQDSFEEDDKLHLVFDYCPKGDLFGIVQQEDILSERRALNYTYQILLGIEHMHRNGFAHRDLSLENVLVNDNDECQICDFGLVASIPSVRSECVGKPFYMAPEVLAGMPYDPTMADSWSLGVILFMLLTGHPLFAQASQKDQGFQVASKYGVERLVLMWRLDSTMSPDTLDLLIQLLKINPKERSSVAAALRHPAFNEPHTMIIRAPELRRTSSASSTSKIMSKFVQFFKRKPEVPTSVCLSVLANSALVPTAVRT